MQYMCTVLIIHRMLLSFAIICVTVFLTDALDYGQNKKALQLADKVLKKQSDLSCAKVSSLW